LERRGEKWVNTKTGRVLQTNLATDVKMLSGWASPSSRDWKDTPGMATEGVNPDGSTRERLDQLPRQAAMAVDGWRTPDTMPDAPCKGTNAVNVTQGLGNQARGTMPSGSPAATERPGALNPAFPCYLQGFPTEWCVSAVIANRKLLLKDAVKQPSCDSGGTEIP
jgi:hypothetical protein